MTAPEELPVVRNGRARKWRRMLGVLSGVVLVVLGAGWWIYGRDEAPPDDADMQIHFAPISDAENGMVQLGKLDTKLLDFDDYAEARGVDFTAAENIAEGLARNDTVVDAFLASAAPELQKVDALLALPIFEDSGKGSFVTEHPEYLNLIRLGKVLRLRAQRRAEAGDYAGATDDVLRLRHLTQRFGEEYLPATGLLMAFDVNSMANEGCTELLNDKGLPASELARLEQAWSVETSWAQIYSRGMMMQYLCGCNAMGVMNAIDFYGFHVPGGNFSKSAWNDFMGAWLNFTLQPNTTRRLLAEVCRPAKRALAGTYIQRPQLPYMHEPDPLESDLWLAKPNGAGRGLVAQVALSLDPFVCFGFGAVAADRLTRVGLALRQYYNAHHELPPSLDALVPQYLAAVPMDPYDGKPLRYDQSRALVYSVGTDLSDHHGSQYVNVPPDKLYGETPFDDHDQPTLELKFAPKPGS